METKLSDRKVIKQSYKLNRAKYSLSALGIDILFLFFAQIKKEDVEFKQFHVAIKDLEKKLGKKIHREYLEEVTDEFLSNIIRIQDGDTILKCNIVSSARFNLKEGWLTLKISDDLKSYLLGVDSYFSLTNYANVTKIKGAHGKRIYSMMSQYKKLKKYKISVDDLLYELDLEDKYKNYYDFKKYVIEPSVKNISEKTDLIVSYNEIKTGRKVTDLEFFIKENKYESVTEEEKWLDSLTYEQIVGVVR